jgi:hypothetical protein
MHFPSYACVAPCRLSPAGRSSQRGKVRMNYIAVSTLWTLTPPDNWDPDNWGQKRNNMGSQRITDRESTHCIWAKAASTAASIARGHRQGICKAVQLFTHRRHHRHQAPMVELELTMVWLPSFGNPSMSLVADSSATLLCLRYKHWTLYALLLPCA